MPPEGVPWKAPEEILTFEEIERFAARRRRARASARSGSPAASRSCAAASSTTCARLRAMTGLEAIALTTNGDAAARATPQELRDAGLHRVNISLDSLDPEVYATITRGGKLDDALAGLDAALDGRHSTRSSSTSSSCAPATRTCSASRG